LTKGPKDWTSSLPAKYRGKEASAAPSLKCQPIEFSRLQFEWKLDFAGAGPGLQNRCAAYFCVAGGFDSH
jgi:hypothetical protein